MIQTYISMPKIRQAVQWDGQNFDEIYTFTGGLFEADGDEAFVFDKLHSSWVGVYIGQWIVKGSKGEFYPVDRQVFAETYTLKAEGELSEDFWREFLAEMSGAPS